MSSSRAHTHKIELSFFPNSNFRNLYPQPLCLRPNSIRASSPFESREPVVVVVRVCVRVWVSMGGEKYNYVYYRCHHFISPVATTSHIQMDAADDYWSRAPDSYHDHCRERARQLPEQQAGRATTIFSCQPASQCGRIMQAFVVCRARLVWFAFAFASTRDLWLASARKTGAHLGGALA